MKITIKGVRKYNAVRKTDGSSYSAKEWFFFEEGQPAGQSFSSTDAADFETYPNATKFDPAHCENVELEIVAILPNGKFKYRLMGEQF